MKPTLIMATALFLLSAPPPDARDIAEMTANFIVPASVHGSLTADQSPMPDRGGERHSGAAAGKAGDAADDPGGQGGQDNPETPAPAG